MIPLILVLLGVSEVYCDSHSLRYYRTAVSSPGFGLPLFSAVGFVDDREIAIYNSDTRQYLPKADWMNKMEPEYWERQTEIGRNCEVNAKLRMQAVMKIFNQTGGFHILQRMYGCELRDDGTTDGFMYYGYDGREFMYLDTQSWMYIPSVNGAQVITQQLNSPEVRKREYDKNYLENECIDLLKKHVSDGREDLEKRVRPEVKVWGRGQSDGVMRLQCLAYGFHPRAVDVKWVRNGGDQVPSDEMSPILPHPDGTYQIRVSVEVPAGEEDSFSCHVDHSSLEKVFVVKYESKNNLTTVIIAVVVGFIVLLIIGIVGFLVYRRRCGSGKTPANRNIYVQAANKEENSSTSSST